MQKLNRKTILVVEDDEALREVICSSLAGMGCRVLSAGDGQEAFQILQNHLGIDLIISDIRMPGGSGMDLLKKLNSEFTEPPHVILMTGYTDVIFSEALKAGAHSILTKPFTVQDLLEKINLALQCLPDKA